MRHMALASLSLATLLTTSAWLGGFPLRSARADDAILSGTLKTIKDRGTLLVGYRENSAPFAFKNKAGEPVGFSLDLCHGIAEQVARRLNSDLVEANAPDWQKGVRIAYVPVASDARLQMVVGGAIDVECGSTTANVERAKTVAFSPIIFLAGAKILAPVAAPNGKTVSSYGDLAGRKLAVATGTTTYSVVKALAGKVSPAITVVDQPSVDAAYAMLSTGAVDAIASDDILLSGLVATKPDGRKFGVVGDYLSYEPYAIMFRKDDPDLAGVVRASFEGMAASNTLATNYKKWFQNPLPDGQNLAVPMSAHLTEFYRLLGQPD